MSKIKLLLDVVSDMRSLADSLQAVCEAMAQSEPEAYDKKPDEACEAESKKTVKSANKKVKLEEVRAVLAEKSQAGMTAKVREIIEKYGATKLSEIDPKHYAEVLKAAEGLVNE
ncbi:hypothetical protein HMPREF1982_02488 [Clostridiales bacterium oral taxon 876 str. F0540]|nr:hypothetical protein HMPREF1982_02488 [Clostridiales bacterium oral taxon 876 str. F0540]